jgi:predicted site-specific integrase-resolvase
LRFSKIVLVSIQFSENPESSFEKIKPRMTAHRIGYARVSTRDQNLDLQRDALRAAGCDRIYEDTISGTEAKRPGLAKALD